MEFKTKLRALEDHFVILWILVATVGYIILSWIGHLDFRQYVFFLFLIVLIYSILRNQYIFWFFFFLYVFYLLLIRANFINSPIITKVDQVFSKASEDIVRAIQISEGSPQIHK